MESINRLLDEMEGYVQECNSIPFSKNIIVSSEILMEFMADFRMQLPEEVQRARRIIKESEKIVKEAKETARSIEEEAKLRAQQLTDEHKIKQRAISDAQDLIDKARSVADEITDGAYEYAGSVLSQNYEVLKELIEHSNEQFGQYNSYLQKQLEIINRNRSNIQRPVEEE